MNPQERQPIRILHVVGAMNMGGTETMLMNIYRKLDKRQMQFDFVSYSGQEAYYDHEIERMGGKVFRLPNPQSAIALYKVMKSRGPYAAVHAHTLFHCGIAIAASALAGVPVRIAHAHTTLDKRDNKLRQMYFGTMRALLNRLSTHRLACSREAGNYLFGRRNRGRGFSHFPNVIDYSVFLEKNETEVNAFKEKENLNQGIVIGHIGRFVEAKNHVFLLEVMKRIVRKGANAKLLLVGDGDFKPRIQKIAEEEGLSGDIRFVGLRDDIGTMLHAMDVFAFPSTYEGLGLVLLEAQAGGLPCIVSEAIQPEADVGMGLITRVPLAAGADAWADAIIEKAGRREKNAVKIIDAFERNRYSIPTGIAELIHIYERRGCV
ncbi:glycosyltransferase family 1 protein [Paenibacillus sp.]|uniref:glycosyltransferase family 1 protein n=1 Tax=Paenibacillus sp. TaxID=58172 RepID=UPI002810DECF|nr:glycosyltransferase family 1 protein [Paenibacillus sp.]